MFLVYNSENLNFSNIPAKIKRGRKSKVSQVSGPETAFMVRTDDTKKAKLTSMTTTMTTSRIVDKRLPAQTSSTIGNF